MIVHLEDSARHLIVSLICNVETEVCFASVTWLVACSDRLLDLFHLNGRSSLNGSALFVKGWVELSEKKIIEGFSYVRILHCRQDNPNNFDSLFSSANAWCDDNEAEKMLIQVIILSLVRKKNQKTNNRAWLMNLTSFFSICLLPWYRRAMWSTDDANRADREGVKC